MKIPPPAEREAFYQDLRVRCMVSRQTRQSEYDKRRAYYLFGTDVNADAAIYNKIYPSIDTLTSFLFAVDTTKFVIKLGTSAPKDELNKIPPLKERLNDKWQDSNADIIVSNAVTWALVYNTMIVKLIQRGNETHPFLLQPQDFGVLREEEPMLDRQEAFVHIFKTTRPQLERELESHPKRATILARLTAVPAVDQQMAAGLQRVIINSNNPLSGGYTGNVNDVLDASGSYRPMTQEEMIELTELWLWDDAENDWRVVTMADPDVCIYDRTVGEMNGQGLTMFMKGEHPFTHVCPNPAPDYFWGYSEVERLIKLQDLREHHLQQVTNLVDKNVNPPKALQGVWGAVDEKDFAMQRLGAIIGTQDPIAKVEQFKPEIPSDLFQVINMIDAMFDETISLNNLSKGHGDTGVRSKGQTESLLRVGSSRPKKRALTIEDSIERIATLYLKLDQQHNKEPLHYEKGDKKETFIAEQFTKDYMVKVDAHSSSPVFVEDQKKMAMELFQLQVIDGEDLLEMLQPQNLQNLQQKYKEMQKRRAQQQAQEQAAEQAAAQAKGGGSLRAVQ